MPFITTAAAAKRLKLTRARILAFIREGRLKAERPEGMRDWLISTEVLAAFAKQKRRPGRPSKGELQRRSREEARRMAEQVRRR